jgi:hypothetical protein
MKKGSTKKGSKISYETMKEAIENSSGNVSGICTYLGLNTNGSVYYLLKKWPDLKGLQEALSTGKKPVEEKLFDVDSEDAPILTPAQIECLEAIDRAGGLFADVSQHNFITVKNLADRGFIELNADGFRQAVLTETGDIARVWHIVHGSKEHKDAIALTKPAKPFKEDARRKPKKKDVVSNTVDVVPVQEGCASHCIHEDVLSFIIAHRPDLQPLIVNVTKMKAAEREALSILGKFGGGANHEPS